MVIIILFILVSAVFSNEEIKSGRGDIWFGVNTDLSFYSTMALAYGGGFTLGYGSGSSIGIRVTWLFNQEKIDTLELCFILRLYLRGSGFYSGPYLQLLGGPTFFNRDGFTIPSQKGILSAGLGFGWRFLYNDRWFVEPSIRAGYPYIYGFNVSAGVRF